MVDTPPTWRIGGRTERGGERGGRGGGRERGGESLSGERRMEALREWMGGRRRRGRGARRKGRREGGGTEEIGGKE